MVMDVLLNHVCGSAGKVCLNVLPSFAENSMPAGAGALLNELAHTFTFNVVANFFVPRAASLARSGPLANSAAPLTIATILMPTALSPLRSTGPTLNPTVATAWASMLFFDSVLGRGPKSLTGEFWLLYAALLLGTLGGILLAVLVRPSVERAWAAVYRQLRGRRD
jgi:glycerol uptake facilitator-like aquaporin